MRAVVTGGAGFIGAALVDRLLAEGDAVEVVDDLSTGSLARLGSARSGGGEFRFHQLDVAAPELAVLLARRKPEVVFHLASAGSTSLAATDPAADAESLLVSGLRVIEACKAAGVGKLIVAMSGAALLGMRPGEPGAPLAEREASAGRSLGGPARQALLDYLASARARHGLEFSALALGTVYGPGQLATFSEAAVACFARALAAHKPARFEGDGRQTRDFVYVDDVVDALARAKARGGGLLLNVGTGVETSLRSLWSVMTRLAGADPGWRAARARPGDVARCCLDPSRAAIHLGWRPWTTLEVGVAAVIEAARSSWGTQTLAANASAPMEEVAR
jgi:UDP-glucose 4-epimerase